MRVKREYMCAVDLSNRQETYIDPWACPLNDCDRADNDYPYDDAKCAKVEHTTKCDDVEYAVKVNEVQSHISRQPQNEDICDDFQSQDSCPPQIEDNCESDLTETVIRITVVPPVPPPIYILQKRDLKSYIYSFGMTHQLHWKITYEQQLCGIRKSPELFGTELIGVAANTAKLMTS